MAITAVQEMAIQVTDNATAVSKAFTANVTTGNVVVVVSGRYDGGADTAFVAGDCTQSAGTATIGTITLDKQAKLSGTGSPCQIGIWSVPVTGSGSLTMQVAGTTGSYFFLVITEYSGVDTTGSRIDGTPNSNTAASATSPGTTGNTTSTGAALLMAGIAIDFSGANADPVIGGSFTSLGTEVDATAHQTGAVARRIVTTGTTDQASWTLATSGLNGWAAAIVAYKAAGGGGGGPTNTNRKIMERGIERGICARMI